MTMLLRFVVGKYQGALIPLQVGDELIVGSDITVLTIVSDLIAPRHARFLVHESKCELEPLSEAHPVYVNGLMISGPVTLSFGDRVRLGEEEILFEEDRLRVPSAELPHNPPLSPRAKPRNFVAGSPGGTGTISFLSDEVPLADIIQILASSYRTAAIYYSEHPSVTIYMKRGEIYWVNFQDEPDPYIAFARILMLEPAAWYADVHWEGTGVTDEPLNASAEQFLMEVSRRLKERAKQHGGE